MGECHQERRNGTLTRHRSARSQAGFVCGPDLPLLLTSIAIAVAGFEPCRDEEILKWGNARIEIMMVVLSGQRGPERDGSGHPCGL